MDANPERWAHIQRVFHDVADLPAGDRTMALETACDGDAGLKAAVLQLLEQDARADSIVDCDVNAVAERILHAARTLDSAVVSDTAAMTTVGMAGAFGPYRAMRLLGAGGMGVVYLGERKDVGQLVALKVLRDVWVSPAGRVRFAGEQRALARLNHPAIAKLHDADALPDGTPWFAMEYVEGVSLTEHCRKKSLDLRERLRLFRDVCDAVLHAHQHLVIHRDLKPSNILVNPSGAVKLLDFGIAKQLETLDVPADRTSTLLRLLTPNYAAPEQLAYGDVGITSDIYSLGVILYELLTGRLPFDFSTMSPLEAQTAAEQREPAKPSLAAREGPYATLTGKAGWDDLDVLCLTAMHKDPQRRYRSVEALLRDVAHFDHGEPLKARPDSLRYRTAKFVRRNARPLAATAAIVVAASSLTAFYTVRLNRANAAAREEAARTARIQQFMLNLFDAAETDAAPANDLRVITLVDRGVQEARGLDGEPAIQAALYQTLGSLYQRLGNYDGADSLLQSALDGRRRLSGPDDRDSLDSLVALSLLRIDQAKLDDAERLATQALETARRTLPADDRLVARATAALGKVLEERGNYDRAIPQLTEAVRLYSGSDDTPQELSAVLSELADAQFYAGHLEASEALNKRALELDRRIHGPLHPNVGDDLLNLGAIASNREQYADATRYYREALDIMHGWYGEKHPQTASAQTILAQGLTFLGRYDDAAPLFTRALVTQESVYGPVNRHVSFVLNELGQLELRRNNLDAAEQALARALAINRELYGSQHFRVANSLGNLGGVYFARNQFPRAEKLLREAVDVFIATLSADHVNTAIAEIKLGRVLSREHRYREAEDYLRRGLAVVQKQPKPPATWVKMATDELAGLPRAGSLLDQP
jgi:eukaryotic-like serine/threonine-protein kinase